MDSSSKKIYGVDAVDHQNLIKQYFSPHVPYSILVDSTISRMQSVYNAFCTGIVTGKTLIDFCHVPILSHLFPMTDFVEDIALVQINDEGVQEIEKWLTKHPDACDWSHAAGFLKEFRKISDESDDEEENTRRKIKVLKWDISGDNPCDELSLKDADIVTCLWFLETICKDEEEYRRYLRKLSSVMKPEGFLLIQTNVNSSYFKVGEETFHFLPCDESFYRKVLCEEGFTIKHCETFHRAMTTGNIDHQRGMFIVAQKVMEVPDRETS